MDSTVGVTRHAQAPARSAAIDGLRGLALAGMMAWHAEVGWVRGGFARMTIFFVLAGFLSTRTVRRLAATPGSSRWHSFGKFWARRVRRLLPLTLLGVALAVWVSHRYGGATAHRRVLGDTLSVLFSWSNWRFIAEERSYGAFFESPSAFQHFWSLSAEEQCFLLLPIAVVAAAWLARRLRPSASEPIRTASVLGAIGVAGCLTPLVIRQGADTVYYGTHVRFGEFLCGAALAVAWEQLGPAMTPRGARRWAGAGALGLIALVTIMLTIGREGQWIYRGGMALVVIPVVAVFGGILSGGRFVNVVLGVAPLRWLGRAALSIYALHWPIYQVVREHMLERSHWLVVTVEFAVSLVVGSLVFIGIERPLLPGSPGRAGRVWGKARVAFPTLAFGVIACIVAAAAVPPIADEPTIDELAASDKFNVTLDPAVAQAILGQDPATIGQPTPNAEGGPGTAAATPDDDSAGRDAALAILSEDSASKPALPVIRDPGRIGVALYGGSTALSIGLGSDAFTDTHPAFQAIPGYSPLGCGLLVDGRRGHNDPGNLVPDGLPPEECRSRLVRWAATVKYYDVNVAVIVASSADFTTWKLTGDNRWRALGDPVIDEAIYRELLASVDYMMAAGASRVVVTNPVRPTPKMDPDVAAKRRKRMDRYTELLHRLARERDVTVVDLMDWSSRLSRADYLKVVRDGVHVSRTEAHRVWTDVLGPVLEDLQTTVPLTPPG